MKSHKYIFLITVFLFITGCRAENEIQNVCLDGETAMENFILIH